MVDERSAGPHDQKGNLANGARWALAWVKSAARRRQLLTSDPSLRIDPLAKIDDHTILEGYNRIFRAVRLYRCSVGRGTYILGGSSLHGLNIGRYCSIGPRLRILIGVHPASDFVSTHPSFYSLRRQAGFTFADQQLFEEERFADEEKRITVEIGNDVWVGADVTIASGVRIGNGAIIGTRALVTQDIEPYAVVGGVPARKIRVRFEPARVAFLEKFRWWEKEHSWIEKNWSKFNDIEAFITAFEPSPEKAQ